MNCHSTRDLLPELLDTRTPVTVHTEARAHLATCPDCQRELAALREMLGTLDTMPAPQPSRQLRRNFYAMLAAEKAAVAQAPAPVPHPAPAAASRISWRWLTVPFAAAALLTAGFVAGQRAAEPLAANPAPSAETLALQRQIERLQDQVNKMGTLVSYSLLQQQPANDRLRGVFAESTQPDAGQQTIDKLIGALLLDPNVNVRLSALEGLYAHADEGLARQGVIASLNREGNPLVQLRMIDFLTAAPDRGAKPILEKIFADSGADQSVRAAARIALAQL